MSKAKSLLLIDDDPMVAGLIEHAAKNRGQDQTPFDVHSTLTGKDGLHLVGSKKFAVIILDLGLPDVKGLDILKELTRTPNGPPTIVLTGQDDVATAVECLKAGAFDYVTKPFDPERLMTTAENASVHHDLRNQVDALTEEFRHREGFARFIGESATVLNALSLLRRAASSDVTLLIQGESGTGKEVAARAVHREGDRCARPFVAVNCGAIPENLIESELFGFEKGAFTGANETRKGHFESADGGTIFLDEIGELAPQLQVRLLRLLQERAVQRVGSRELIPLDARVIAATHKDLKQACADGEFREDLYYRLCVFPVTLPPLRERELDILLLAERFLKDAARRHHREIQDFREDVRIALLQYHWPGNVRELENVVERAVMLEDSEVITLKALPNELQSEGSTPQASESPILSSPRMAPENEEVIPFAEEEKRIILRALIRSDWNVQKAADSLALGRATIYRKIERYDLKKP